MESMSLLLKGVQLWNVLDSSRFFCRNVNLFPKNYKAKFFNSYVSDM